jgi:hypothetical protein
MVIIIPSGELTGMDGGIHSLGGVPGPRGESWSLEKSDAHGMDNSTDWGS